MKAFLTEWLIKYGAEWVPFAEWDNDYEGEPIDAALYDRLLQRNNAPMLSDLRLTKKGLEYLKNESLPD